MSTILVTGAAGFIGSHVVERLREAGHAVTALDIRGYGISSRMVHGKIVVACPPTDIRDSESLADPVWDRHPVDACVHLAAIAAPNRCKEDPSTAWETNVRGTYNVLNLLHRIGARRIVFASTAHVFGVSPRYLPTDEQHPLALGDCYTSTKIAGEQLCDLFWRNHNLSYCALRFFNAYGSRQSDEYFVGAKMKQGRSGGPVTLRNGDITKDFVHASDVADAVVRAIASDYVGPLNVGTGTETNLRTIASHIANGFGTELVPEEYVDGGPTRMCADISRARSVLGWEPKVTVEQGLAELIRGAKEAA